MTSFGKLGAGILISIALLAVTGPMFTSDPTHATPNILQAPSSSHPLGTNDVGQDVLARLVAGARTSGLVAIGVGFLSTLLSALMGISAGLVGGLYERILMRLVDTALVLPSIVVLILLSAFLEPGLLGMTILISLMQWAGAARLLRSQTLSLKQRPHVLAARTFGAGRGHLILRHILPDLGPLLVVTFVLRARAGVFMEAGLAFIGITAPGFLSWGTMIRAALSFYYTPAWLWWLLPAGLCLSLLILSLLLLGQSLEEAFDPRLRHA